MFNSPCLMGGYITKHPFRGWFLSLACIRPCLDKDLRVCCLKVSTEWSSWQIRKPPPSSLPLPKLSCMWNGWSVGPSPLIFGSINLAARDGDLSTLESECDFRELREALPTSKLELSKGLRICMSSALFPYIHLHATQMIYIGIPHKFGWYFAFVKQY